MALQSTIRYPKDGIALAELEGRMSQGVDLQTVEQQLMNLAKKPGNIVILDLSKVDHSDSAGLGVLLFLNGALKDSGGSLRLAGVKQRLLEIFQITHTDRLLTLDPDAQTSLSHVGLEN